MMAASGRGYVFSFFLSCVFTVSHDASHDASQDAIDNAIANALEVATTAAVAPGSVAAEADECMFCVGPDGGAGFLVYSQNGIVRQIQPVS